MSHQAPFHIIHTPRSPKCPAAHGRRSARFGAVLFAAAARLGPALGPHHRAALAAAAQGPGPRHKRGGIGGRSKQA